MKHQNKKQLFHLRRVSLFAVLIAAFFIVRLDAGALPKPLQPARVLAYATEMSPSGLLSGTNAARSANGLAALSLNAQLNNSAQMKAEDMANKNYWAHVSPDGNQPWYFFNQAGYVYIRAGENLAYGFSTSQELVDGWMNSPSHRANVLGNYNDVGFGIATTPNYQNSGEQTIVVAHYGAKSSDAPAPPAAAPVAPATPVAPAAQPSAPTPPAQSKQPEVAVPKAANTNRSQPEVSQPTPSPTSEAAQPTAPVKTGEAGRVTVLGLLAGKNLPLAALTSLLMVGFTVAGYALTHRAAFSHAVSAGEHFVVRHPGFDAGIVAAVTSLILLTTYGNLA